MVKKTKEESRAENFFPVKEKDARFSVSKPNKDNADLLGKAVVVKEGTKKKTRKSTGKVVKFEPVKMGLKRNGYELIITEKPQAAMKIASALGDFSKKTDVSGINYYEVSRGGRKIVVACAVGHLFNLNQDVSGSGVPIFDISWKPNFFVKKGDFTKRYYDSIARLMKGAGSVTIATDYDVEGEVIGMNVMRFLCGQDDACRMKFSTLTAGEINRAYDGKADSINWGMGVAGETRHFLDWFYGINLSRALMNAIKSAGSFKIMSVGRVQGPALNLIVNRERDIQNFKPKNYWQVFITIKNSHEVELKYDKDLFDKSEIKQFDSLVGCEVMAETTKKERAIKPLFPFDLTTLQTEAYKHYGFNPSKTLRVAQSLYLAGLISYPRTSSQKLPASVNYREILSKLAGDFKVGSLIKRNKPVEGFKTDPAHPSIYPTGSRQALAGDDAKVYSLIARRFLALFCEDAVVEDKRISVEVDGKNFFTEGLVVKKKAWMSVYPYKLNERDVPDVNGLVKIESVRNEQKETQPPKRYTVSSIISELERLGLGTKATRSAILETLYNRGYVKGRKNIEATQFGISLIGMLERHSPVIIDDALTRMFEEEMELIAGSDAGDKRAIFGKSGEVLAKAKQTIEKIAEEFVRGEAEIGRGLMEANAELREKEAKDNLLNKCPKCEKGKLKMIFSRKTKKNFVGCDGYPDCENAYSLPPSKTIKKMAKKCEKCGFPILSTMFRRRKWEFCFNSDCEVNRDRVEKYRAKKSN